MAYAYWKTDKHNERAVYKAIGVRLDSGNLAYLSCKARKFFCTIEEEFGVLDFGKIVIAACNDLNEETLDALKKQVSIPCKKWCYRLYRKEGSALVDTMTRENEPPPKVAERILCPHPFNESKRAYVVPQHVEDLLKCFWPSSSGKAREELPPLKEISDRCAKQLEQMRCDHMRRLNPTPYKANSQFLPERVSVSAKLNDLSTSYG